MGQTLFVCVKARQSVPRTVPPFSFPPVHQGGGKFSLQFIAFYIETVVQDMICLKNGNSSRIAYNNQNHTGNTSLSYSHPTQCIQQKDESGGREWGWGLIRWWALPNIEFIRRLFMSLLIIAGEGSAVTCSQLASQPSYDRCMRQMLKRGEGGFFPQRKKLLSIKAFLSS